MKLDQKIKVKKQRERKRKKILLTLLLGFIITLTIFATAAIYLVVIPAQKVVGAAQNIASTFNSLNADLEGKDLTKIDGYFESIKTELNSINEEVDKYSFLQDLSFTRGYYQNLQIIKSLSGKTQELLVTTLPELKVILKSLGYKTEATDPEVAVVAEAGNEEKLQGVIRELPKIIDLYTSIEPQILEILGLFNQIDSNYVPALGIGDVRKKIISAQKVTAEFPQVSAQVKETLRVLPSLLGSETPADYLVVFQNEKEMRASGGLLTAYGNLTIDKGELGEEIEATDMWDLEGFVSWTLGRDVGYRNIYGQNALMNEGCGSTYLRAQDSGIYPDLYLTMNMFKDYYEVANNYNPRKYPDYDFIIILNTFFASDMISLVEPVVVPEYNIEITSENLAKEVFKETSTAPFDPATRKDFIGALATAMKDKFNNLSSSDFLTVVQKLIRTVQAKNLAFYAKDEAIQAYFDEFGMSGRIEQNFSGDYFHLNEAQNCSLKANFYIYDIVNQNVNIADDGAIGREVKIEWVNEKVHDPAEESILSGSYWFRYRAWVRLFMPKGSVVKNTDGYEKSLWFYFPVTYFDLKMQKQMSDNIIWFDHRRLTQDAPVKRHTLNVSYSLPDTIRYTEESGYRLLVQKHPGKKAEQYNISINYKGSSTSASFTLDRDKVVSYRGGIIRIEDYDKRLDPYYDLVSRLKEI